MPKISLSGVAYVILIVVLVLFVIFAWGFISLYNTDTGESHGEHRFGITVGDLIDFQFHSRYEVDTSGIRRSNRIVDGTPYTDFVQVASLAAWAGMLNSFNDVKFEYEDFDFNFDDYPDKYLIVTFGRELVEMETFRLRSSLVIDVSVTFGEEYHGDVMFFYVMDNIPIANGSASEFYIMNGEEKVYTGSRFYLNEVISRE